MNIHILDIYHKYSYIKTDTIQRHRYIWNGGCTFI